MLRIIAQADIGLAN